MLPIPQIVEKRVARTRLDHASSVVITNGPYSYERQWSFGSGGVNFMVELRHYSSFVELLIRHCSDDDSKINAVIVFKDAAGKVNFGPQVFNVTNRAYVLRRLEFWGHDKTRTSLCQLLELEQTTIEITFEPPVSRESARDACSTCLQILHDKTFTDCMFKIGDAEIKAHRCFLVQRSEVFRAMFSQESTNEAKNRVIEIKDSDVVSVNAMLEYMYSGAVELTIDNVEGVMLLADKYDVKELIQDCIDHLIDSLDRTSFIRTAVLGDLCSSSAILEKCGEFLKKNRLEIFKSVDWQELKSTNQGLVISLMELAY